MNTLKHIQFDTCIVTSMFISYATSTVSVTKRSKAAGGYWFEFRYRLIFPFRIFWLLSVSHNSVKLIQILFGDMYKYRYKKDGGSIYEYRSAFRKGKKRNLTQSDVPLLTIHKVTKQTH